MAKKRVNSRHGIVLTAIVGYSVLGVVNAGILWLIYPDTFMNYVPLMCGFFIAVGMILILVLNSRRVKSNPVRISNAYLMSRMVKLALTVAFLGICVRLIGPDKKAVIVSAMIFYLTYMFFDLYIFILFSKRAKKNAI